MKETIVGRWENAAAASAVAERPTAIQNVKKLFCEKVGEPPTDGASVGAQVWGEMEKERPEFKWLETEMSSSAPDVGDQERPASAGNVGRE